MLHSMIIVRLSGGLGNQIFQYAAGRVLALRRNTDLALDLRFFQRDRLRNYALAPFSLKTASLDQVSLPPSRRNPLAFALWRMTKGRRFTYCRERSFSFDPAVLKLGPDTYLHGYWQSENYFQDAATVIRADVVVRTPPSEVNAVRLRAIANSPSVSVHVRRGDYVSNSKTSRIYGACPVEYYQAAAQLLAKQAGMPLRFWVFSDDPEWAAANIGFPFDTRYVTHRAEDHPAEDLRMMSACRDHIIANSTFSWWGAWLNPSPDKIVVAPKRWFNDPGKNDQDLVPADWIRI